METDHDDCGRIFRNIDLYFDDLYSPKYAKHRPDYFSCKNAKDCVSNHELQGVKQMDPQDYVAISILLMSGNYSSAEKSLYALINQCYFPKSFFRTMLHVTLNSNEGGSHSYNQLLKRHIKLYPPCNPEFKAYYLSVLTGTLTDQYMDKFFLRCTLKYVLNLIKGNLEKLIKFEPESNTDGLIVNGSFAPYSNEIYLKFLQYQLDTFQKARLRTANKPCVEKLEQLFETFTLLVDILDQDLFICSYLGQSAYEYNLNTYYMYYYSPGARGKKGDSFHTKIHLSKWSVDPYKWRKVVPANPPIISKVFWASNEKVGVVNDHCKMVFGLLPLANNSQRRVLLRYLSLAAEVTRMHEKNQRKVYPFFDVLCKNFAKEFADSLKANVNNNENLLADIVEDIQPPWLNLLVTNEFLKCEISSDTEDITLQAMINLIVRHLMKYEAAANYFSDDEESSSIERSEQSYTPLIEPAKREDFLKVTKIIQKGGAVTLKTKNSEGVSASNYFNDFSLLSLSVNEEYVNALSTYNYTSMNEFQFKMFTRMMISYIQTYHITSNAMPVQGQLNPYEKSYKIIKSTISMNSDYNNCEGYVYQLCVLKRLRSNYRFEILETLHILMKQLFNY